MYLSPRKRQFFCNRFYLHIFDIGECILRWEFFFRWCSRSARYNKNYKKQKNNCIYFIEIKTRSNDRYGKPYEAVTNQKISHLQKAADYFLLKNPSKDLKLKLAVVSIQLDINEIKFFEI